MNTRGSLSADHWEHPPRVYSDRTDGFAPDGGLTPYFADRIPNGGK